jgi:3-hydroxybutyryl-CoA dehydratase
MKLAVGQTASYDKTITEESVLRFAELSGDSNPLHVDEKYAKQTRFGRPIAHGALTFAIISAALGTKLPGTGAIFLKQSIEFIKPVYFGDTITATVEVSSILEEKELVTLSTECTNQRGELIARGEATMLYHEANHPRQE